MHGEIAENPSVYDIYEEGLPHEFCECFGYSNTELPRGDAAIAKKCSLQKYPVVLILGSRQTLVGYTHKKTVSELQRFIDSTDEKT